MSHPGHPRHEALAALVTYEAQPLQPLLDQVNLKPSVYSRAKNKYDPYPERGKICTANVAGTTLIWRKRTR